MKILLNKYVPIEHTLTMANGGRDSLNLAMEYTRAYKEEMAAAQAAQARERKERLYLGIVSAVFELGAITMVFIEGMSQ